MNMSLQNSVFILLISLVAMSQLANADLITDVCSKSRDPAFCGRHLRADPRAHKADLDLKTLTQISIDITKNSAESVLALAKSLSPQAKDKVSKKIYKTCVYYYRDAVGGCDLCTTSLKMDYYSLLYDQAASVQAIPNTCDGGFSDLRRNEPLQLIAMGRYLQDLADIIMTISLKLKSL